MNRNVYLQGELADRFGEKLVLNVPTLSDLFKLLYANDPTLKQYMLDCGEKGISFSCELADRSLAEEEGLEQLEEGDLFVAPVPSGSKSGGGKLLAALAIVAFMLIPGPHQAYLASTIVKGGTLTYGQVLGGMAVNLALSGIQQLMLPDPATDKTGPKSYLFDGSATNMQEGDPVPLLYGELRVPGRPISFEVMNENTHVSGFFPDFMFGGLDFQFQQTTPEGHLQGIPAFIPEVDTGT